MLNHSASLSDKLLDDHLPLLLGQPRQGVVGGQRRHLPVRHHHHRRRRSHCLILVLGGVAHAQVVGQLLFGLGLGVEQVLGGNSIGLKNRLKMGQTIAQKSN